MKLAHFEMNSKLTPLMRQYWDVKTAHKDKVLLFRMGDFFEIFHDDALTAAPVLGIALTKRNQKSADETPMCGVPHHSIGVYINKLLKAGHKVAICDQVEDAKFAKGIVKRAVTRILTPGMVFDPDTLDQLQPNYIAAFDEKTVAFADPSTFEAFYFEAPEEFEQSRLLEVLRPSELLLLPGQDPERFPDFHKTVLAEAGKSAAETLKNYVSGLSVQTQAPELKFEKRVLASRLELTQNTIRHLEIFENNRGQPGGSLFSVVNKTKTPGGARLLRSWLAFPLARSSEILERQAYVTKWISQIENLKSLREGLSQVGDIERRTMRLANSNANARDMISLSQAMCAATEIKALKVRSEIVELCNIIAQTIVDEPPAIVREGHIIKKGVSSKLDELIKLSEDSQQILMELELREKQKTGISSLKVRYNNVFGYSIEITNTHKAKVPTEYRRKQTLASAERYVTDELEELEKKILSARSQRVDAEIQIFEDLRLKILSRIPQILELAKEINELDVVSSLAWLAIENDYSRPEFSERADLYIEGSRHPVVEKLLSQPFVANTLELKQGDCMLLTGPNMAGKSTLMRQAALTVILAQIGSYVPSRTTRLPVFSKILTRIGASDSLSEGLSTFMVEMKETAELIQEADKRSLVILDEVGRGTATHDGMSLAQAILEHLLTKSGSTIFFATHYHELTGLEGLYPNVRNRHMGIRERAGQLSFLYTLLTGPASKSYGIHVAKLAGLPPGVVSRAEKILAEIEGSRRGQMSLFEPTAPSEDLSHDFGGSTTSAATNSEFEKLAEELKKLPIESTTPLDALNFVARWRENLGSH